MSATTAPADVLERDESAWRGSARRVLGLARANALLLRRNRTTLFYAVVVPLAPLALMFAGPDSLTSRAASTELVIMLAMLFPVYYALLSMVVTRRDELLLQRLRTGEVSDRELLLSLALPGAVIAAVVCAAAVGLATLLGAPLPLNPLLLALSVALMIVLFSALAFATAAFTRSAESAQLTSAPVLLVTTAGSFAASLGETGRAILGSTPGGALVEVVRAAWFGLEVPGTEATLSFGETFAAAAPPLVVIACWTVAALWLARSRMRWAPRV